MAFAFDSKKPYILAAAAICAAMIAGVLATAAPGAVAASRWLSLPGFALPGWAPLVVAAAAVALLRRKDSFAMLASFALLTVSVMMSLVCAVALL